MSKSNGLVPLLAASVALVLASVGDVSGADAQAFSAVANNVADDGDEVGVDGVYNPETDTNSLDADTDDDGSSDGDQQNGTGPLEDFGPTNPLEPDSDDDGIETGVTDPILGGISPGGNRIRSA
jgi:hypothetical protein